MNLYLKYRPKTVDELDLSGVRKTLTEMMTANNLAHAYLLTGPRGAGKTSTARVLARIVNCEHNDKKLGEPCNICDACKSILDGGAMDVIEIDAASNRGIDDIRELKEKIRLAPSILRTKVYIIDEVHMLTTEAFNALLKTLEEPPSHSLFILCTTELHKVPETIVSRCVQVQFTKATAEEMKRSFARVVQGEGKSVDGDALEYLATSVDGSFRDGVKVLDQVLSHLDKVTLADIEQVVSGSVGYKIESLAHALAKKDVTESLAKLNEAVVNGVDLTYLLLSLMRALRDMLLQGSIAVEVTKLIFSLDEVARRLATSLDGELLIQVAIVEWCGTSPDETVHKIEKSEAKVETIHVEDAPVAVSAIGVTEDGREVWKQILGSLGQNNLALDTILSKARPGNIHGDELTVYVQYDFHKQQLMSEKNRAKFEEIITKAVGRPMKVRCEIGDSKTMQASSQTKPDEVETQDGTIDEAMSIFTS
jgi:DNA polymerase III subunit gamma/tau